MSDSLQGSCLCGDVRYEVRGPFPRLYQCHCSLCRKQGGSVSNTGLIMKAGSFRWRSGEANIGRWQRPSGFRSWFCARCGSTVPNPLRDTGYVWVPAGTLDDDAPFEVAAQVFLGSRMSCDQPRTDGLHFEEAPALAEFIALLHGGGRGESSG